MTPFTKPHASIEEHIARLRGRGLIIADENKAAFYLSHIGYYRLTAYWLPFEACHNPHRFAEGVTFEQVLQPYLFDRNLRLLLMDAIERIEISIRTKWVSVIGEAGGAHAHLNPDLFSPKNNRDGDTIWSHQIGVNALMEEEARSKEQFILHFRNNYDEDLPPIWASCELMTFGGFSKWYENTKQSSLRNKVSRSFGLDETILKSFLHHVAVVRNLCAHHSRVWNRSFTFTWRFPRREPKILANSISYDALRTIYNTLSMLAYLMNKINPETEWHELVIQAIDKHNIDPAIMGFPEDYQDRPIWDGSL